MGLGMHPGLLSWDPKPPLPASTTRDTPTPTSMSRDIHSPSSHLADLFAYLKTPEPLDQHQVRALSQFKTKRGQVEDGSTLISYWGYISPRNHSPGNRAPILHPSHPPIPLLEHPGQHQDNRGLIDNANH